MANAVGCEGSEESVFMHHSNLRPRMVWKKEHDLTLCQEVFKTAPYQYKPGTRERGQSWSQVAFTLNQIEKLNFSVDQRGVRERFNTLERKFKKKILSLDTNTFTVLDQAIDKIVNKSECLEEETNKEDEIIYDTPDEELESPESIGKRALEALTKTQKDNENDVIKSRMSGTFHEIDNRSCFCATDTTTLDIEFKKGEQIMKERQLEHEYELKRRERSFKERQQEQEMELRKREHELRVREQESRERRDSQLIEIMQKHQQQQQMLFLHMQQQNQTLLNFFNNVIQKKD